MVILTCANSDKAKNDKGKYYKNFSFRKIIKSTVEQAERCGYKTDVYDLGDLGFGDTYRIDDESFVKNGYYEGEVKNGYKSKSLFKPSLVLKSMKKNNDLIAYLDGDAQLCSCIDEVNTDDYDIGVTLRDKSEIEGEWHKENIDIVKYVNAGVIFFRPTSVARSFVERWALMTEQVGNDQMALNNLACPESYPDPWSVKLLEGVRIKYFPCLLYNYYYFDEGYDPEVKILHFKGPVRKFYPFTIKKKLYCRFVAPFLNKLCSAIRYLHNCYVRYL